MGAEMRVGGLGASAGAVVAREQLTEIQRARIVAAMVEESSRRGAADATVSRVVARAGVSRRTFYELFEDREDCFLAAFDDALVRITRCVRAADDPKAGWAERIRPSLAATLGFADAHPAAARLLIVSSLGAGTQVLERRRRILDQIAAFVDQGRTQARTGGQPPPLTAEGVVGGALAIVHARLLEPEGESLLALGGPLMAAIVMPYLGPAAARRELTRKPPKATPPGSSLATDPLLALEMRLTYRTVRALTSVAAHPGSSNREIGLAADIHDQGQVSKLLTRLHKLGLIENEPAGLARGASNSWVLTDKGRSIQQAIGRRS